MAGIWSHRVVQGEGGKLYFAWVRFRPLESKVSGMLGPNNRGETIEDMRKLARELLAACDQAIIGPDGIDPNGCLIELGDDDD